MGDLQDPKMELPTIFCGLCKAYLHHISIIELDDGKIYRKTLYAYIHGRFATKTARTKCNG